MMFCNTCVTLCALGCLPLAMAQEKPKQQLTARELFYAAVQAPAATPAHPSAKARSRTGKKAEGPEVAVAPRKSAPSPGEAPSHGVSLPGGASLIPASAGPPLGLRYNIVKVGDGGRTEVSADTPFHAGDQIQINVQPNLPGYLYIVSRGSSGTWKPVFPSPEVDEGNNHVDGLVTYTLPSKTNVLTFDEQPGFEKLFIVLSREPEPDLEKMIYSLQSGSTAPRRKTDSKPAEKPQKQLLVASNIKIDDQTVGNLRTVYARDLVIEKVNPDTPGDKKETAVYVVNPTGSADSRVVADLQLVHQ